jgi:diadenylate cyclase
VVDILIVAYLFYWTYNFLLNTKAVQLLKGVVVIFIVAVIAGILHLETLEWLIKNITTYLVITVIILFQPELRRLITRFGQRNWLVTESTSPQMNLSSSMSLLMRYSQWQRKR